MRDAEAMPDVVDPSAIIEERLKALAAEHESRLKKLDRAVVDANGKHARHLKRERRQERRAYRRARRKVQGLSRSGIVW